MFLCWAESTMRDFLALQGGGKEMRLRYNAAYGRTNHPPDFARTRLELSRHTFGTVKNMFLDNWSEWKDNREIRGAIERIVIYRNGFGHAQVQPFRDYLLYTPNEKALSAIKKFTKCDQCFQYMKDCRCKRLDSAEPLSLIFRCLDKHFLCQLYGDIRTVDVKCFLPTARCLVVEYQGIAWPTNDGHTLAKHSPQ